MYTFRIKYNLLFLLSSFFQEEGIEVSTILLHHFLMHQTSADQPQWKGTRSWKGDAKNTAASLDILKHTLRTLPDERTYTTEATRNVQN